MSDIVFKFIADTSNFSAGVNSADAAQKKLGKEVDDFNKGTKKAYDDASKGVKGFADETDKATGKNKALKQEIKELQEYIKALQEKKGNAAPGGISSDYNKQINEAKFNLKGLNEELKKMESETENVIDKNKSLKNQLKELKIELADATDPEDIERLAQAAGEVKDKIDDAAEAANLFASGSKFEILGNQFSDIGSKLVNLDFSGAAERAELLVNTTKQLTFKDGIGAVKDLGTTFLNLGKALLLNPLFLITAVVVGISAAVIAFKDDFKLLGAAFDYVGKIITNVTDTLKKFSDSIGLSNFASTKAAKDTIQNAKDIQTSLTTRYDYEIMLATAAGKSTENIEIKKQKAIQNSLRIQMENLAKLSVANDTTDAAREKSLGEIFELQKEYVSAGVAIKAIEIGNEKKKNDELEKANKEYSDKRKKIQEDLKNALIDLANKAEQAELNGLTGEAKLNKQKELAVKDYDLLRNTIEKAGQAKDKDFKFSLEQEQQFANLKTQIQRDYYIGILQLAVSEATKQAQLEKSLNDTELQNLEFKNQIITNGINSTRAIESSTNAEKLIFTEQKNIKLLEQEKKYQSEKLQLVLIGIQKEADIKNDALNAELVIVETKTDAISQARVKAIEAEINSINTNSELAKQAAISGVDNIVAGINDSLSSKSTSDINIYKLLGLDTKEITAAINVNLKPEFKVSEADVDAAKKGLQVVFDQVKQILEIYYKEEQERLDAELNANQKKIDQRNENIKNLQEVLEKETDLRKEGYANNVEAINEAIAKQNDAKKKDLENEKAIKEEKKKLAKEQLIIDTITQGSQIVLAIAQLYGSLSGFTIGPVPVGLIIATAASVALVAGFAAQKSRAFDAAKKDVPEFKEGGYTGDGDKHDEAGIVHKGEFVSTKEKTKKFRNLLDGIHNDDNRKIELGLSELLKHTGVSLADFPKEITNTRNAISQAEYKLQYNSNNFGIESRLDALNKKFDESINKETITPLHDGRVMIKKGNSITYIKTKI